MGYAGEDVAKNASVLVLEARDPDAYLGVRAVGFDDGQGRRQRDRAVR